MVTDGGWCDCGDYFIRCKSIKLLCSTPETNITLYANYNCLKQRLKKSSTHQWPHRRKQTSCSKTCWMPWRPPSSVIVVALETQSAAPKTSRLRWERPPGLCSSREPCLSHGAALSSSPEAGGQDGRPCFISRQIPLQQVSGILESAARCGQEAVTRALAAELPVPCSQAQSAVMQRPRGLSCRAVTLLVQSQPEGSWSWVSSVHLTFSLLSRPVST